MLLQKWSECSPIKVAVFLSQVCELDIIFNFEKAYFMLDELLLGGEIQETSKKNVLKAIAAQDLLQEASSLNTVLIGYYDYHLMTNIGFCDYFPNFKCTAWLPGQNIA